MTDIRWVVTTETNPWVDQAPVTPVSLTGIPSVILQLENPQQTIEGFGASFNEMGWDAISMLSQADQATVYSALFEPGVGLNFTNCRMPVGANDFSRDWYSYDETEGDFALSHFSIANDQETLIPFIREAKKRQPALKLWASPWSPPTWMKRNKHYAGIKPNPLMGAVENGLRDDQIQTEGTDTFILDEAHLTAYANYFGKFIDAYAAEGISIGMVMPQNEFNSAQVFPSCTWTSAGLSAFVKQLGPEMAKRNVEVFLGTLERPKESQAEAVLDDPEAGKYISGVGVQWAGKGAVAYLHRNRPDRRIYQSEQECGDGENNWRYARYAWSLMKHYMTNGANGYMYWNMALLEGGVSRWGWAQNSLVVVDPHAKTFRFSHEFQVLRHVSHFVQTGARAIPAFSFMGYENQIAFANPDGSIVLVVQNDMQTPMHYRAVVGDQVLEVDLPADSFSTFVVPA